MAAITLPTHWCSNPIEKTNLWQTWKLICHYYWETVNDFQALMEGKFHCHKSSSQNTSSQCCSNSTKQIKYWKSSRSWATAIRLGEGKSYVSNKPINTEQRDFRLSEPEWAVCCVLSRQLNFRQLNILGNVWKLNCEGEQRQVSRIKRCGETQKASSYQHSPTLAGCIYMSGAHLGSQSGRDDMCIHQLHRKVHILTKYLNYSYS